MRKRHSGQFQPGAAHPRWNNGQNIQGRKGRGYLLTLIPEHPRADKYGYVYEHILVLEKMLGRPVLPTEAGHHLDGNKLNNDPKNLVLFATNGMHIKFHMWLRRHDAAIKGELQNERQTIR